jgi:hypothetical protein
VEREKRRSSRGTKASYRGTCQTEKESNRGEKAPMEKISEMVI